MPQELLLQQEKHGSNYIPEQNIDSLISYVQYLADNKTQFDGKEVKFDSSLLLDCHKGRSVFLVDKYLTCAVPSAQLEFLLESQGIMEYGASLDGYKHSICSDSGSNPELSEIFSPNIVGDHFNPYIRFKSCCAVASRTCSKVLDLVGLEPKVVSELAPSETVVNPDTGVTEFFPAEISVHDNVFLDIVCTFPSEIDLLLVDVKYRSRAGPKISKNGKPTSALDIRDYNLIDRMNRCRSSFFKQFNKFFTYGDPDQLMGCSSSLHVWSSAVPMLPNAHVHNLVPFFSYNKSLSRIGEFLDLFNCPDLLPFRYDLLSSVCYVDNGSKKVSHSKMIGPIGDQIAVKVTNEVELVERFIVDESKYKELRLALSNHLKDQLGFQSCVWANNMFPVDVDLVKKLWSDCVKKEFQELNFSADVVFDVHIQFIPWYHKSKLLHSLQYKSRPAVLDLELFFQKLGKDLVTGFDSLDFDAVFDYLYYELQVAINCSNTPDIAKYESYIVKLQTVVDTFSEKDVYEWLQFLSTWVTDTRVFGFWRTIKRYMLDPDHELLVEQHICPLCNGQIASVRKVPFCVVDSVIVRSRSTFMVYDLDGG